MGSSEALNKLQQQAVDTIAGPVLVSAPPGSGKSRIIVYRVARLIENGVDPSKIMVSTFTRKAANELKDRIAKIVGSDAMNVTCGTFHSICLGLLRHLSRRPVKVIDEAESRSIISELLARRDIPLRAKDVALDISYMKAWMISPEEAARCSSTSLEKELSKVYAQYEQYLRDNGLVDFDSIIIEAMKLFNDSKNKEIVQSLFRYILVDEYQDVNYLQSQFVHFLAEKTNNIFAVGDASQAIYGFMGANLNEFREFPRRYAGCKPIFLDLNYRSKKNIVEVSNSLISGAVPMKPVTNDVGERVVCIYNDNPSAEADFIQSLVSSLDGTTGILVRAGWQMSPILEALDRNGISYNVVDDTSRSLKDDNNEVHRVSVMTIHASKGLEFDNVIVVGLEEGIIPYKDTDNIAEERRLFYVAVTRAKARLYLLVCLFRNGKSTTISRFLKSLSEKLIEIRRV